MLGLQWLQPVGNVWSESILDATVLSVAVAFVVHRWIVGPLDARLSGLLQQLTEAKQEAERLSQVDPLTGIPNRRTFFEQFDREWSRSERNGQPMSLVMLDIDFFKRVNDEHGHRAGDATLKRVAEVIYEGCRRHDYYCRYGGEEFCILLTDADLHGATQFAERLRSSVSETEVCHDGKLLSVTVSLGVAQRTPGMRCLDDFIEAADQALFRAKQAGRDRVEFEPIDASEFAVV